MSDDTIQAALKALTKYVRNFSDITGWDLNRLPTIDEIAARKSAIEAVCNEIDALSQRSDARFQDFELLQQRLATHFAFPMLNDVEAVARAFLEAGRL
jgi:hypothetical protein